MPHHTVEVFLAHMQKQNNKSIIENQQEQQKKTKTKKKQINEPRSEKPQPRMSTAQASMPASSSNGCVYLHSKQELNSS